MRRNLIFPAILAVVMLAAGCAGTAGKDTVFQTSTIHALMEGAYDGDVTMATLQSHGDLGIGTFNALDGEMIMLDGDVYQARSDGTIHECSRNMLTPFASVTFFEPDISVLLTGRLDFECVTKFMDTRLTTTNLPWAVRLRGRFSYVKTRAVARQARPYPRLIEATKTQPIFERKDVAGTIVGFRLPAYVGGINVPGWHLHFISDDKTFGGHLLAFEAGQLDIGLDSCDAVLLSLPTTGDFAETDLTKQNMTELEKIEK